MKRLQQVVAIVLGLVILASALNKILSSEWRGQLADGLNVPGWFLILVSLFEIVLAVCLFVPRFRVLGGVGVLVTMVGAIIFTALGESVGNFDRQSSIPLNVVLGLVGLVVAWLAVNRSKAAVEPAT